MSSQLAFNIDKVAQKDQMHIQTLSEPGHGNISVVPNYPDKNWKLGTLKITCKLFDMTGYQPLLINYNELHQLLNINSIN